MLLDRFAHELIASGSPSPQSTAFQRVRSDFPIRHVAHEFRQLVLQRLAENPRSSVRVLEGGLSVDRCISDFKRLLQQYCHLDRGQASPSGGGIADSLVSVAAPSGQPHMHGFIPEISVELADPPVIARIDLVITSPKGDTLIDYKSSSYQPEHAEQTLIYAVIWAKTKNRAILDRVLIYADGEQVRLGGLNETQIAEALTQLRASVGEAVKALKEEPPVARPNQEHCQFCPVRQLCPEYWIASATVQCRWTAERISEAYNGGELIWRDLEIDVAAAEDFGNGFATDVPGNLSPEHRVRVLASVPSQAWPGPIAAEKRVRLLTVGLRREGSALRVVFSPRSEVFWEAKTECLNQIGI
jgi:PD-(D/E)XK nuclease superfamily